MQGGIDACRGKHKGMSIPINMWSREKEDNRNKKENLRKWGHGSIDKDGWTSTLVELNMWFWCMLKSPDPGQPYV